MRKLAVVTLILLSLVTSAIGLAMAEAPAPSAGQATPPRFDEEAAPISTVAVLAGRSDPNAQATPDPEHGSLVLIRETIPPGASIDEYTHLSQSIIYVESGTITVTAVDGEIWARCASGCLDDIAQAQDDSELIPVGADVELQPGDWVQQYREATYSLSNPGTTDAVILLVEETVAVPGCLGHC